VDTSDSHELTSLKPDPARKGSLRRLVVAELNDQKLSGYGLWMRAHKHCPTITQSAVYEFLRGQRSIGLEYIDAIMKALDLTVVRRSKKAG